MKTYIKTMALGLLAPALFAACQKEKVMTFEPTDCVYFKNPTDTSRFTFALLDDPQVESAVFTVAVDLAGSPAAHDRTFHAEVIEDARNPQTRYEILGPSLLRAGESTGTVEVRVWRTENLETARDTITIALKGSPELIAEFAHHSTRCITFYNRIDKPAWWNFIIEYITMGKFHEIKMQILNKVLGSMDDPTVDGNAWPYYKLMLNRYCEENDVRYPENDKPVRFQAGY